MSSATGKSNVVLMPRTLQKQFKNAPRKHRSHQMQEEINVAISNINRNHARFQKIVDQRNTPPMRRLPLPSKAPAAQRFRLVDEADTREYIRRKIRKAKKREKSKRLYAQRKRKVKRRRKTKLKRHRRHDYSSDEFTSASTEDDLCSDSSAIESSTCSDSYSSECFLSEEEDEDEGQRHCHCRKCRKRRERKHHRRHRRRRRKGGRHRREHGRDNAHRRVVTGNARRTPPVREMRPIIRGPRGMSNTTDTNSLPVLLIKDPKRRKPPPMKSPPLAAKTKKVLKIPARPRLPDLDGLRRRAVADDVIFDAAIERYRTTALTASLSLPQSTRPRNSAVGTLGALGASPMASNVPSPKTMRARSKTYSSSDKQAKAKSNKQRPVRHTLPAIDELRSKLSPMSPFQQWGFFVGNSPTKSIHQMYLPSSPSTQLAKTEGVPNLSSSAPLLTFANIQQTVTNKPSVTAGGDEEGPLRGAGKEAQGSDDGDTGVSYKAKRPAQLDVSLPVSYFDEGEAGGAKSVIV